MKKSVKQGFKFELPYVSHSDILSHDLGGTWLFDIGCFDFYFLLCRDNSIKSAAVLGLKTMQSLITCTM